MRGPRVKLIAACLSAALAATGVHGLLSAKAELGNPTLTPEIKHVFTIVLENQGEATTFAPTSPASYLSQTLRSQGAFLPNYFGIGHESLDNYIAMVSGQSPNAITQSDCMIYTDVAPAIATANVAGLAPGQVIGQGCVYPPGTTQTVANTLEDHGFTWKGYMEDMGTACRHPALNSRDGTQSATATNGYAARHNPFVYFHSLIDNPPDFPARPGSQPSSCVQHDVDYSQLANDLRFEVTTPNYSFIVPNLCHDGHDTPCVDPPTEPGGLPTLDKWLQNNVPAILNSPAYKDHGLLMILFDEGGGGVSPTADASGCCNEQSGPNTVNPGGVAIGPGGGKTGAVLLSPCIAAATVDNTSYNHYSMLRSVENFFSLPYLGYSGNLPYPGQVGPTAFGSQIFTQPDCGNLPVPAPPTVSITAPADGATYDLNQVVLANFSCHEGAGGPGIFSCLGPALSGHAIDTSIPGPHAFKVTATSQDGQSVSTTANYTVRTGGGGGGAATSGSAASTAACVVPKLKGKKLKAAKKALRKAHCHLRKVKHKGHKPRRVRKQRPKPGSVLPPGSKVKVKLKGKPHH